jgi:hypothetical protein
MESNQTKLKTSFNNIQYVPSFISEDLKIYGMKWVDIIKLNHFSDKFFHEIVDKKNTVHLT